MINEYYKHMKTLTFKQVHEELEQENNLITKEHNILDFSEKSKFLESIGFVESKATKMYTAIVKSQHYISDFNMRYKGQYKFILKEQLERVCEKYNLFVRPLEFFAGDIPEKNIKDMMNFKFYLKDAFTISDELITVFASSKHAIEHIEVSTIDSRTREKVENDIYECLQLDPNKTYFLSEFDKLKQQVEDKIESTFLLSFRDPRVYEKFLNTIFGRLCIAAVESLFTPSAFVDDHSRLGESFNELSATGQVDLDPIVMIKNHKGYIIITAWGDEANHELIANQNLN